MKDSMATPKSIPTIQEEMVDSPRYSVKKFEPKPEPPIRQSPAKPKIIKVKKE